MQIMQSKQDERRDHVAAATQRDAARTTFVSLLYLSRRWREREDEAVAEANFAAAWVPSCAAKSSAEGDAPDYDDDMCMVLASGAGVCADAVGFYGLRLAANLDDVAWLEGALGLSLVLA